MDKKYELYYQNYETKNGTEKEFQRETESLNLWDIKPILGTQQDIDLFIPKVIKTSGRNGIYYIHSCLVVIDPKTGCVENIIYKIVENIIYKIEGDNIIWLYY